MINFDQILEQQIKKKQYEVLSGKHVMSGTKGPNLHSAVLLKFLHLRFLWSKPFVVGF